MTLGAFAIVQGAVTNAVLVVVVVDGEAVTVCRHVSHIRQARR